ncbi:MAPEG family protein [Marinivivus vitaminiproducens]|uniref:MAPEG family protein n=1 Tax=Marinivivus vitaminiproducens TaxID=3035935 RepID=UPI0027A1DD75|nr:MAPEG family protein [Geminicoccaceae bacterium SCSIO 64248]
MSVELTLLAFSVGLGLVHVVATGMCVTLQDGLAVSISPRDDAPALRGAYGRVLRSYRNFMETFAFFLAAVLMAETLDRHNDLTAWGAHLYVWGRLAYIPLYVAGVPVIRSLVWAIASLGIVLVLAGAALG